MPAFSKKEKEKSVAEKVTATNVTLNRISVWYISEEGKVVSLTLSPKESVSVPLKAKKELIERYVSKNLLKLS